MPFTLGKPKDRFRFLINPRHVLVPLLLVAFASVASAHIITGASCQSPQAQEAIYPPTPPGPDSYPMTSDEYAVQYQLAGEVVWTTPRVYISKYGGSYSSPWLSYSGYTKPTSVLPKSLPTSMSFVSITVPSNTTVMISVTKLQDGPFAGTDGVSVRPSVIGVTANEVGGVAQITATTQTGFNGEQFILWWDRDSKTTHQGGGIQGLAFFLNPSYPPPSGKKVDIIGAPGAVTDIPSDMDFSGFNALDFEGTVAVEGSKGTAGIDGAGALLVPSSIGEIYLGPDAWVQGKLRFAPSASVMIKGPGVLDVSRFQYNLRACGSTTDYADEGYYALSSSSPDGHLMNFTLDGIIISDTNHAATDLLYSSAVNNVKTLSWNAENGGLRFEDGTTASNVFVRSGDDSLMVWGSNITITNATVWQNYNGGVVNLGWTTDPPGDEDLPGDNDLIDGLYVVKTDWQTPPSSGPRAPSWENKALDDQNNAVIASLMLPGAQFDTTETSLFRNIFVEDAPRIFLSLKILASNCSGNATRKCPKVSPSLTSVLNLDLENVLTPPSTLRNSIGFQDFEGSPLPGSMNVGLFNFFIVDGSTATALTSGNAVSFEDIVTNGDVSVEYSLPVKPPPPPLCKQYTCM